MLPQPYFLHALSPLHAGTGQAMDLIDLPIARYKATGIPFVPGSSIKGVLRDAKAAPSAEQRQRLRSSPENKGLNDTEFDKKNPDLVAEENLVRAVFGPEDDPSAHAGALTVGDARLLALPVRSFRGTFAWVSCPLLLHLAGRDLGPSAPPIPSVEEGNALVQGSVVRHQASGKVFLEDIDLDARDDQQDCLEAWAKVVAPVFDGDVDWFAKRFVVVHDETMTFLWETATQVDQRVRIDSRTRTVADGALWLEESLPPETLLIGLIGADRSRRSRVTKEPAEIVKFALSDKVILQFGGKASVGRGRCRLIPWEPAA